MAAIPEKYLDLLEQKKAFASLCHDHAGRIAAGHAGMV